MTAPVMRAADLEQIIRDAVECTPYWMADKPETHQDPYENAARDVLAALEKAGTVEWGVRHERKVTRYGRDRRRARLAAKVRGTAVSRLTLPWRKVVSITKHPDQHEVI